MRSELRLAFRSLARRPLLSAAIVFTVGGALAAATVAFAAVNGVLLRPLPYATPARLVVLWERSLTREVDRNTVSPANFLAWRDELAEVERLAAVFETSGALTGGDQPQQVGLVLAAGDFFALLGARPVVGRLFDATQVAERGSDVAVIAERYWRSRFGADPTIVGRTVLINGTPREVVGVLADRFAFAPALSWAGVGSRDFYLPIPFGPEARSFGGRYLQVLGRLTSGATVASAQQEASALASRLRRLHPDRQQGWDVTVRPLHADIVGDVRTPIAVVFGAVCLVLLIAGANVANLLLARATERRGEMVVRAALGAGRLALVRQLFGESTVLVAMGGVAGTAMAFWGTAALKAAAPDIPRLAEVRVDAAVMGFMLVASLLVAAIVGIGPALEASRGAGGWLSQRGGTSDRRGLRARRILVGAQVTLSVVLLVGAGVLIRSLANRLTVDLGVETAHVLTAQLNLPGSRYPSPERRVAVIEALLTGLSGLSEVDVASVASIVPMTDQAQATSFVPLDRPPPVAGQAPVADVRFVHHRYLDALRVPVLAGRGLTEADRDGSALVVLVNETGARQLWPGESPIGKRIAMEWGDTLRAEVVGVVGDVRLGGPDDPVERPTLYWDYRQSGVPGMLTLVVRGRSADPGVAPIRAALAAIDPDLPLYNVRPMEALRATAVAESRFVTVALGMFAALALGLAALGVYGVTAYAVEQRTREIGVRLALGADRAAVVRMLLRESGAVVLPALAFGVGGAWLLSDLLRSQVFGVSARDPVSTLTGFAVISLAALAASWIPARRASAIPAAEAMRAD